MRKLFVVVLLLLALPPRAGADVNWIRELNLPYVPYDARVMRFCLSPDEAAERARRWLGDRAENIQLVGVTCTGLQSSDKLLAPRTLPFMDSETAYLFSLGSDRYVSVAIHPWLTMTYHHLPEYASGGSRETLLPMEQRKQAAEAFVATLTPRMDLLPHTANRYSNYYNLLEQGICHLGRCLYVSVNAATGEVGRALYTDCGPTLPPGLRLITEEQAVRNAVRFFGGWPGVVGAELTEGEHGGLGIEADPALLLTRVEWGVPITVVSRDKDGTEGYDRMVATVDAVTGDVLGWDCILGDDPRDAQRKHNRNLGRPWDRPKPVRMSLDNHNVTSPVPPVEIGGVPYVWCRWLAGLAHRPPKDVARLDRKGVAILRCPTGVYRGRLGKSVLYGPAGPVRMSGPLIVDRGHLLVPAGALRQLLKLDVVFKRADRELTLTTPRAKAGGRLG